MEKQQLLEMGFSDELASQALSATAGSSISGATEWILSQEFINENNKKSPIITTQSSCQPKINHFFRFNSSKKPESSPDNHSSKKPESSSHNHSSKKPESSSHNHSSKKPEPSSDNHQAAESESLPLKKRVRNEQPLAERMRPQMIDQVVGQDHLLAGKSSLLRSAIDCDRLPSLILWGPPGTGKTSIGRAIVNSFSSYRLVSLSAVTAGVKDVRDVVDEARKRKKNIRTVLLVDEVHRFNKSQLDSFLPVIEDGSIVFIGATTENPSFHLITPLLSRCRVVTLNPLEPHHIATILKRAIHDPNNGLAQSVGGRAIAIDVTVSDQVIEYLSHHCDGDARVALNALEISAIGAAARQHEDDNSNSNSNSILVVLDDAKEAMQSKHLSYDKGGEQHYNLISALHKSMRGSDGNASIYWLARMLEGGEEPLYIARRLIQFSSEDVGLADPSALTQAVSCYQACHFIGMPECSINLAQCVAYLAHAPKSVAVYRALEAARKAVRDSVGQNEGVPLHLRNAPTKLMKQVGYGKGYIYPPHNPSSSQSYLPVSLQGSKFLNWPEPDSN